MVNRVDGVDRAKLLEPRPVYRPLKVYAFDPTRSRSLGNYMTIQVPYEPLQPGPVGARVRVIDYDVTNQCYYWPVDLEDPRIMVQGGLDPSESDPRFHQQMVYAVVSETIRRFELALGRRPRWQFNPGPDDRAAAAAVAAPAAKGKRAAPAARAPARLRIFPHAMQEANAFYSRELRALLFGYFPASLEDAGVNLPGQVVFTCLSHDIVAHETTHALVDGQRSHLMEDTCVDSLAFHEAFADIVALFQHFGLKEAVLDVIQRTGGKIYAEVVRPEVPLAGRSAVIQAELTRDNPLVGLAQQFGEAMGLRKALRSAIGTPPNSNALETTFEPHERGAILVAAVFDAFFSVYVRRTADLMRIARAGGLANGHDDLHPDLASRLADEATKTAGHFANICIRALDYCPAVEITFGDFLRAIITADSDTVPDDPYGYRAALIEAFRSRGIRPDGVASYAEESLRWSPPEIMTGRPRPQCVGLNAFGLLAEDPDLEDRTGDLLREFVKNNWEPLGLNREPAASVPSFHAIQRARPDGGVCTQVVATALQDMEVLQDPTDPKQGTFTFRGGTTIVFDRDGNVVYAIQQRLGQDDANNKRLARTREQRLARQFMGARLTYENGTGSNALPLSFELIHRGY